LEMAGWTLASAAWEVPAKPYPRIRSVIAASGSSTQRLFFPGIGTDPSSIGFDDWILIMTL
jgi:hypothetical protein